MRSSVFFVLIYAFFLYACQQEQSLFEQIPVSQTGIDFSNRITENDTFNIISFEYVYNGGGVGVGDFNSDGLMDLFFTGNMIGNKLYLNQGNFSFKDISTQAGVRSKDHWNSGVAVVDINNDGWLDLYVCATTYEPGSRRRNRLFINQGIQKPEDNTSISFREEAAAYGIADESHTTNAAFFDYDNDGDLDLYLLINQMDENAVPSHFRKIASDGTSHRTDKLYRNDFDEDLGHPIFTDISKEAGISIEGYGLGINISDLNRDGWKDIYVSNDYLTNDLLWINNGYKTDSLIGFENKASTYLKHTSYSAMGNNIADLNNDGLAEIVALDMLPEDNLRRKSMLGPNNYMFYVNNERYGYQYQYVRNTLQLNQGNTSETKEPNFSEISMLAGISSTDWSWTPLIADFDHDGMRDLIITNGFPKDVTDRDFMEFSGKNSALVERERLEKMIPSVKISNYAFQNDLDTVGGIPSFKNVTKDWGLQQPSFSNGAAYADLDNDGDLDFISNNINDSAFIYRNTLVEQNTLESNWLKVKFAGSEKNLQGLGAIVDIYYSHGKFQTWENTPYRGYLSSVEIGAHFGLGTHTVIDSLVVRWQEGRKQSLYRLDANQEIELSFTDAQAIKNTSQPPLNSAPLFTDISQSQGLNYIHKEQDFIDFNIQRLLPHKLSQYGPGLAVGDVNGDGLDDIYVGGSSRKAGQFFIQSEEGSFTPMDLFAEAFHDNRREELGLLFFDADNDGDEDLYCVSGGYESNQLDSMYTDRLFFNEGGNFIPKAESLPDFLSSGSCVKASDFDRDGDLDLFVGGRVLPAQYPQAVSSYLLINDGLGNFSIGNEDHASDLIDIGLVSDALWTDFDNDGWIDLMLAGEWMPLSFLHNEEGILRKQAVPALDSTTGFWNSLSAADFDLDGDIDYVAGNLGTNTLLKASRQKPISIYMADFDANDRRTGGTGLDAIPTAYFPNTQGELTEFPYFGKTDMEKQLISIKKLYLYHKDYALASMTEILKQFPDIEAQALHASYLESAYIENLGNGQFRIRALPQEAQLAPVYAIVKGDFNQDNLADILLTGNDYGTELGMGRSDALNGLLLINDGKGPFTPLSMEESGISIPGDGKSLVKLFSQTDKLVLLAGQNKGPLKAFSQHIDTQKVIPLNQLDCVARIELAAGKSYREELPYGNSFLSQSARRLFLPKDAVSVEIEDSRGKKRKVEIGN
ncbi:MAG: VCBS repeat-containing protein [Bacteroidota bacterium]